MKKFHVTMKSNVFSIKKSGQSWACLSRMTLAIRQFFWPFFLLGIHGVIDCNVKNFNRSVNF